jgi:hypothetical protein
MHKNGLATAKSCRMALQLFQVVAQRSTLEIVAKIAKGRASIAVARNPKEIPYDCNNQVKSIVIIAPKDMRSPCEKFAKRRMAYMKDTPRAPKAS